MFLLNFILGLLAMATADPATEASYKGQFCTDPRTMRKHAAYTEWADAYSCTRHRCQPGGRNLAIYTVGCKRVEAPESAIECEEVVEDTNMQFPYCCTRLRCLVVVRGEVWTRVLGQPWETLPAAPWSHMYKMKKPPPADGSFLPKQGEGPVYELQTEAENEEKTMRAKKTSIDKPDCKDAPVARASAGSPDIVIALSTNIDPMHKKTEPATRRSSTLKRGRKQGHDYFDDEAAVEPQQRDNLEEPEEIGTDKENKPVEPVSDDEYGANNFDATQNQALGAHAPWTEAPQSQWTEHNGLEFDQPAPRLRNQPEPNDSSYHVPDYPPIEESKMKPAEEKAGQNLQALVNAIGTRMKDIESVVQKMTDKVTHGKPAAEFGSGEKTNPHGAVQAERRHHERAKKKPNPEGEGYKRFADRNRGSKYLHTGESTSEQPLFSDDNTANGYFSDASNIMQRAPPKEPAATYMAPVENRRKQTHSEESAEKKKYKKKQHKKKRTKPHHKKHHGKEEKADKRKRFNKVTSVEAEGNVLSLEDDSGATTVSSS